jgi:heme exporter protein C
VKATERTMARLISKRSERVLGRAATGALAASAALSLAVAPPDALQGDVQRLMYVHVPAAWLAYQSFAVVFIASIAYLRTRRKRWDQLALASAEIGVLFTALTIVLGALWGKPTWGTWWTWDPRLTTTAILLLIYVGYLAVRRLTDDRARRASWAAVVGIVGFIDVPIVHLSVVWWRSLHQRATVLRVDGPNLDSVMLVTLLVAVAAFMLTYLYLLSLRMRVARLEDQIVIHALAARMSPPTDRPSRSRPREAGTLSATTQEVTPHG